MKYKILLSFILTQISFLNSKIEIQPVNNNLIKFSKNNLLSRMTPFLLAGSAIGFLNYYLGIKGYPFFSEKFNDTLYNNTARLPLLYTISPNASIGKIYLGNFLYSNSFKIGLLLGILFERTWSTFSRITKKETIYNKILIKKKLSIDKQKMNVR